MVFKRNHGFQWNENTKGIVNILELNIVHVWFRCALPQLYMITYARAGMSPLMLTLTPIQQW